MLKWSYKAEEQQIGRLPAQPGWQPCWQRRRRERETTGQSMRNRSARSSSIADITIHSLLAYKKAKEDAGAALPRCQPR